MVLDKDHETQLTHTLKHIGATKSETHHRLQIKEWMEWHNQFLQQKLVFLQAVPTSSCLAAQFSFTLRRGR